MNRLRFPFCGLALAIGLMVCASIVIQQADGQAAAPTTAPDIEIGTPTTDFPMLITPLLEGGTLRDGHHGQPLLVQEFEFDPATHNVGLAKDSPTQQRIYGNTRIDAAYYKSDLSIFDLLTIKREPIGKIILTCANKKIVIAPNYVVTPATDEPMKIDPSTYCAFVQFEKGDECNKPGTTLNVHRNEEKPAPAADGLVSKINRKTDVMTWTMERGGAVVKTGSFGFPVVASEPGLVKYVISLP